MEKNKFIFSKNVGVNDVNKAAKEINYQKGFRDGYWSSVELEKTPEQIKVIMLFNRFLREEKYNLNRVNEISHEKVHFVPKSTYKKYRKFGTGHTHTLNEDIVISYESFNNRLHLYECLLHEMTHIASPHNIYLQKGGSFRVSTGLGKPAIGEDQHFAGLNEFMTQVITIDILIKNQNELKEELKLETKEIAEYIEGPHGYKNLFFLFNKVFKKVAEHEKVSLENIRDTLKKAYFSGSLFPLRMIEGTFGPGSLRILASLGSKLHEAVHGSKFETYSHEKYFSAETEEERDRYMKQIFGFEDNKNFYT